MLKFWKRKGGAQSTPAPSATATVVRKQSSPVTVNPDASLKTRLQKVGASKDKELVTLFNIGITQKLATGDYLFKKGDPADTGYIVLDGAIAESSTVGNSEIQIGSYQANMWLTFADFGGKTKRTSSAQASEATSVLVLDQRLLSSVDDDVLLFIYKELHKESLAQLARKEISNEVILSKNQGLSTAIINIHTETKGRSKNSDFAQTVIQKIPKLPIATISLLNKLLDASTNTNEVIELVKSDPSLTAILLKTLNSPDYNFDQKITDVNHCVSLLGFSGVYQIIMSQSLRKSLPETPEFLKVYTRSVEISHIAFTISQASGIGKPGAMATIGLVHDLGKVVVELLRQQNPKLENLIDSFDTAVIGAQLLRTWNLPETIWKAVEYMDYPEFAPADKLPTDILDNATVLYLARLCQQRLHKVSESRLPMLFFDDYLPKPWSDFTLGRIVGELVTPALRKKKDVLPASLIQLIS